MARSHATWTTRQAVGKRDDERPSSNIFGVPSYVIMCEIDWGEDRLPMIIDKPDAMGFWK